MRIVLSLYAAEDCWATILDLDLIDFHSIRILSIFKIITVQGNAGRLVKHKNKLNKLNNYK